MKKINVALKNCHGIRDLSATFNFNKQNSIAIYAPNGTMKTSFARTFKDFSQGEETSDHMFPTRQTERSISDEHGKELDPDDVIVVSSYDEGLQPNELTSTLLVNPNLRKEYEDLQVDLIEARDDLVEALEKQSKTKQDIFSTLSRVFTGEDDRFFEAMLRIRHEVRQLEGPLYTDLPYDIVFNEKVVTILRNPEVQSELSQYITRLNELLDESTFFNRESFSFYNATNVTKSLSSNGFFTANHSLLLHGESKTRSVTNESDLKNLITEEKRKITHDESLRIKLDAIEKVLQKNADTRRFFDFIASREELLPELANIDTFQQNVWKSHLKAQEHLFEYVVTRFEDTESRRKTIEEQAVNKAPSGKKLSISSMIGFSSRSDSAQKTDTASYLARRAFWSLLSNSKKVTRLPTLRGRNYLKSLATGRKKLFTYLMCSSRLKRGRLLVARHYLLSMIWPTRSTTRTSMPLFNTSRRL